MESQRFGSGELRDEMTEMLADLVERGEVTAGVARKIRALHRNALEEAKEER